VGTDGAHRHGRALAGAGHDAAAVACAQAEWRTRHRQRGDGFTAGRARSGPARADARHADPVRGPDRQCASGGSIRRSVRGSVRRTGTFGRAISADAVGKAIWKAVIGASRPDAVQQAVEGRIGGAAGGITGRDSGASPDRGTIQVGGIPARAVWDGTSRSGAIRGDTIRGDTIRGETIQANADAADDAAGHGPVRGAHPVCGTIRPGACGPAFLPADTGRAGTAGRRN
jgi:hypothetical protein